MAREYKTIKFKASSFDEEKGIFSGLGAVFGNVDSGGDIIEPGAFEKTLKDNFDRIKILAMHNDSWLPIGKPVKLEETDEGLYIEGQISDTSLGKDVKVLLRDGVFTELSIGYDPVVGGFDYDDDGIRHLYEVELWEVSPVIWAMNPEAVIEGYKSAPGGHAAKAMELTRRALQLADEYKSGRKISGARLESLESARDAMKCAVKALDSVIREARDDGKKSRTSLPISRSGKSVRSRRQIEIIL